MSAQPKPNATKTLWPIPVPVIGLTGEKWSGKTLFALTIDPKRTLIYDTEKSSLSYQKLGFARVDVMAEMLKKYPKGHKPIDRFSWWLDHVRAIEPGQYSIIACDTVNEIENGLADWVEAHPEHFGHTRQMYLKMSGIKWGDVKDYWLQIMASELASRCETFVFITHMGDVWGDNKPTGKRKPKGKDTLFQLASLYLQMERKKDTKGNVPAVPSAVVLKDRIADFSTDPATGEIRVIPLMPPRLPVATPVAVKAYMTTPPDYANLKEGEKAPEPEQTAADLAEIHMRTAEAQAETERTRLEREERQRVAAERRTNATKTAASVPAPAQQPTGTNDKTPVPVPGSSTLVTVDQIATITVHHKDFIAARVEHYLAGEKNNSPEDARKFAGMDWQGLLGKYRKKSARELTTDEATDFIERLPEKVQEAQKAVAVRLIPF